MLDVKKWKDIVIKTTSITQHPTKNLIFIKIFKEMVLSRIWSAFIIVAIVVASIKYLFSDNYKAIYNDLVVGKSGDTVQITKVPSTKTFC